MRVMQPELNKNPAALSQKHKTGGSTSGLLASSFNVAASRPAQIHHGTRYRYPSPLLASMARASAPRHAGILEAVNVFFAFGRGGG